MSDKVVEQETALVPAEQEAAPPAMMEATNGLRDFLMDPTLARLEAADRHSLIQAYGYDPIPEVKRMIEEIDINDHMSLVTYGADVLEEMAQAGLQIFTAFQDDTGAEASAELMKFQQEFKARALRLKAQLDKRAQERAKLHTHEMLEDLTGEDGKLEKIAAPVKAVAGAAKSVLGPLVRFAGKAMDKVMDPNGEKALARQQNAFQREMADIEAIIQSQNADASEITQACHDTLKGLTMLRAVLENNRNKPSLIYQQMDKAQSIAETARNKAFLRLIALHEKKKATSKDVTELRERGQTDTLDMHEMDRLMHLDRSVQLMDRRGIDFVGTFTMATTQLQKGQMIKNTTSDIALERSRQETQVVGSISATLGDLMAQNELMRLMTTVQFGNRMQKTAMDASAQGMEMILKEREKVDDSIVQATDAIAESARRTGRAILAFQEQEGRVNERLAVSRVDLAEATKELNQIVAKLGQEKKGTAALLAAASAPMRPAEDKPAEGLKNGGPQ